MGQFIKNSVTQAQAYGGCMAAIFILLMLPDEEWVRAMYILGLSAFGGYLLYVAMWIKASTSRLNGLQIELKYQGGMEPADKAMNSMGNRIIAEALTLIGACAWLAFDLTVLKIGSPEYSKLLIVAACFAAGLFAFKAMKHKNLVRALFYID